MIIICACILAARRYVRKFSKFYNRRSSIGPSTFHDSTIPRVDYGTETCGHRTEPAYRCQHVPHDRVCHVRQKATISKRHARANNLHVEGYDPTKPIQYIA